MTVRLLAALAAAATLYLAAVPAAEAQPMRCSAEEQACIAICNKHSNRTLIPNCIAACRARMSSCRQTGCWDSGTTRYCGLTRQ
ncbi:MAG: hypothetical protein Q8M26_01655 [Pseudolabrys sp.]|nr:hypothetical protein [Pseudolabrys sp.]